MVACQHSMRKIFLHDLYYTPNIGNSIETIFLFAGVEFYLILDSNQKNTFTLALAKMTKGPYKSLLAILDKNTKDQTKGKDD